jgi:hypothetical protein
MSGTRMVVAYNAAEVESAYLDREMWVLDSREELDVAGWLEILENILPYVVAACCFVVVADMPGSVEGTLALWDELAHIPAGHDIPVAFVAQPEATEADIPWDEVEILLTDDPALERLDVRKEVEAWATDLSSQNISPVIP